MKVNAELLIGNEKGTKLYRPAVEEGIEWSTERRGTPGKLTFKVLEDKKLKFSEGSPVRFTVNGKKIFFGFVFKQQSARKEGKVREVYDAGDCMVITATDRISAFDHILKNEITGKGRILTQMSKFWFDYTKDIVPNHMLSVEPADMPEFFRQARFDGNSMKCKKLAMLPIECIVRGYITGSGWGERRYGMRHPPARRLKGIG